MLNEHFLLVQLQKVIIRRKNEEEGQRVGGGLGSLFTSFLILLCDLGQVPFPLSGPAALPVKEGSKLMIAKVFAILLALSFLTSRSQNCSHSKTPSP